MLDYVYMCGMSYLALQLLHEGGQAGRVDLHHTTHTIHRQQGIQHITCVMTARIVMSLVHEDVGGIGTHVHAD